MAYVSARSSAGGRTNSQRRRRARVANADSIGTGRVPAVLNAGLGSRAPQSEKPSAFPTVQTGSLTQLLRGLVRSENVILKNADTFSTALDKEMLRSKVLARRDQHSFLQEVSEYGL